jgi:hypothetical protein
VVQLSAQRTEEEVDEQALYEALDWLLAQEARIERGRSCWSAAISTIARWCSTT